MKWFKWLQSWNGQVSPCDLPEDGLCYKRNTSKRKATHRLDDVMAMGIYRTAGNGTAFTFTDQLTSHLFQAVRSFQALCEDTNDSGEKVDEVCLSLGLCGEDEGREEIRRMVSVIRHMLKVRAVDQSYSFKVINNDYLDKFES